MGKVTNIERLCSVRGFLIGLRMKEETGCAYDFDGFIEELEVVIGDLRASVRDNTVTACADYAPR